MILSTLRDKHSEPRSLSFFFFNLEKWQSSTEAYTLISKSPFDSTPTTHFRWALPCHTEVSIWSPYWWLCLPPSFSLFFGSSFYFFFHTFSSQKQKLKLPFHQQASLLFRGPADNLAFRVSLTNLVAYQGNFSKAVPILCGVLASAVRKSKCFTLWHVCAQIYVHT